MALRPAVCKALTTLSLMRESTPLATSKVTSSVILSPSTFLTGRFLLFISSVISGPPPWTRTGLMSKLTSKAMSLANRSSSAGFSMELPPNLITTFFPLNLEARGYRVIMLPSSSFMPQVV